MNKYYSILAALGLLFMGAACTPPENENNDPSGSGNSRRPSVTVGADHISIISAVLKGKANLNSSAASDLEVGFQYSKSSGILPSNSYEVYADDADANYNYTTRITALEPGTTYYFRSFVRQNGKDEYGETKEFKTKEDDGTLIETLDATEVEAEQANLQAKLDLTDIQYSSIEYGFYLCNSEGEINSYNQIKASNLKGQSFSKILQTYHNKQYWYKAYVIIKAYNYWTFSSEKQYTFYGDVKTFTTEGVPVESVSLDKTEYSIGTINNLLLTLKATVLPANADDKKIEWTSNDTDVAVVDNQGNVIAFRDGEAVITATAGGKAAECKINVSIPPVTDNTIDITYYSCNAYSDHTDINIYADNQIEASEGWGVQTLKKNWASATAVIAGTSYDLAATDGATWTSNKYGKYYWTWAFKNETVRTALLNASTTPVTIIMKDVRGVEYNLNFAENQSSNAHRYKYDLLEAVDLGLSVKWASINLGAKRPEQFGDYFAWGETAPKYYFSWSTYRFGTSQQGPFSKYNTNSSYGEVDNKTVLDLEDDAAHVILGDNWRIPTRAEWEELLSQCTLKWTKVNGVSGCNIIGTNGNSIFLPTAGQMANAARQKEDYIVYWSSTLNTSSPSKAYELEEWTLRYLGCSIRPVSD